MHNWTSKVPITWPRLVHNLLFFLSPRRAWAVYTARAKKNGLFWLPSVNKINFRCKRHTSICYRSNCSFLHNRRLLYKWIINFDCGSFVKVFFWCESDSIARVSGATITHDVHVYFRVNWHNYNLRKTGVDCDF